jgi:hypothetical protein
LFAGEKNIHENRRVPLRLHKLAELLDDDVHGGGNVKIRKVFDVDTISVVTDRLDVFDTTENHPERKMCATGVVSLIFRIRLLDLCPLETSNEFFLYSSVLAGSTSIASRTTCEGES